MKVSSRIRPLALWAATMALGGCATDPSWAEPAPLVEERSAPAAAETPSFDLGTAIERARAAFFEHEGTLVAGSESHRVVLDGRGGFTLTPAHDTALERALELPVGSAEVPRSVLARTTRIEAESAFGAHTASIRRGVTALPVQPTGTRTEDGAVLIARGAVVEELRNGRDGLEQSWRFAAPPAGQDDLEIRVATSGMTYVGTTPGGEHFADDATGLGVRYGHGTWVEADGDRTAVPVRFEAGELVLTVPADVVDASAFPAVLDPTIGPEVAMDTPVTGPRGGNQVQPAIASNGSDTYLLVFTDGLFGDDDVRGARFGATGTLLEGRSFRIAVDTGTNQSGPAVAWNGTSWVVVWQDGRNGVDFDVYGTTVSAAGAVAAEGGAPIAATSMVQEREPVVASAGAVTLLAFRSGDDASSDVVGMRLNASAVSTDAVPFAIGGGAGVQDAPSVTASASQFLVAYDDDPDGAGAMPVSVRGRRINASGTALVDASPFLIATGGFGSDCGYSGTSYLVAWTGASGGRFAVLTGSIPVSGTVTTPTSVVVSPGVAGRDYLFPRLAWNGSEYLAAFVDGVYDTGLGGFTALSINTRRLTGAGAASGAAIDPTTIVGTTSAPDVASLGTDFYVVYVDGSGESSDIRGTRITGTTVATPTGQLLSSGPNDQTFPFVASDGTSWAVTWTDFRSGQVDTWAAILSATGAVASSPVAAATGMGTQSANGIAWAGSRYLVVYDDGAGAGDVRGFTMTAVGIAGATFPIATSTTLSEESPTVSCGPAAIQCLVAWTEYDGAAMTIDSSVRAARVDASTPIATVGAAATVVAAAGNQFAPSSAASSTTFYVAWTDARTATNVDVRGTRFLGSASDPGGIVIGGAAGAQAQSAVASNGTDFAVVFTDQRAGGVRPNDIYLQRVNGATGAIAGTNVLLGGSGDDELGASIAFSGRYLVTWTRANDTNAWLEGARVEVAGTVVDTTPLGITPTSGLVDQSRVAAGAMGRWLVAYRSFDTGTARTVARLVTDDLPNGSTCSAGTACASGFCVDGVCCATACAGGTTDCNACSVAAGGTADGTCSVIAGCGDAGVVDAGGTDAGGTDAGDVDAGGTDAGGTDAGGTDAGGTDAGMTSDTGPGTDGGGGGTDGGRADAGTTPGSGGGCGCAVPARSGASDLALAGLLALVGLIARRRS